MPSILTQSGFSRTARPGIYTRVDASALAGGGATSGRLAVVGDFPAFPSATPTAFSSRRALAAHDLASLELSHVAQLAFNPANDPAIAGGASLVYMCSTRTGTTAAALTLGPLTLASKVYGARGNRLQASLTISSNTHTLALSRAGLSESYEIEATPALQLTNNTGEGVTLTIAEGVLTLTGDTAGELLSVTASEAPTLRAAVGLLDGLDGITAELLEPRTIELDQIEASEETAADGASLTLRAPGHQLLKALASSSLVSVTLDTTDSAASFTTESATATGGADGSGLDTAAALQALEAQDVQLIALMSTTEGDAAQLASHLDAAALAGYERQAYTAAPATFTLEQIRERAAGINRPDVALAAQNLEMFDARGQRVTLEAPYMALVLAAMQAGSDTGEPLTHKRPAIISTSQSFNTHTDAEQALQSGLIFISADRIGPRVERSVTTWLEDNNPIYSEVSSYESALVSLRDLRQALADQIGRPTRSSQLGLIEARATARLEAQVRDGVIKAYGALTLEDLGDHVAVAVEVAPVEPLNFITLTSSIYRS